MTKTAQTKTIKGGLSARIELKTTSEVKSTLEQAAVARGTTLSAFMLHLAVERAEEILHQEGVTKLNGKAWAALEKSMSRPAKAPQALRELMMEA